MPKGVYKRCEVHGCKKKAELGRRCIDHYIDPYWESKRPKPEKRQPPKLDSLDERIRLIVKEEIEAIIDKYGDDPF